MKNSGWTAQVEQVIKEQNMLEVFVMIEDYCHILKERAGLILKQKLVLVTFLLCLWLCGIH